jgi:hypothetical protein
MRILWASARLQFWRYHADMRSKPQSEEYRNFENLLGKVLSVSKEDLKAQMDADKKEKRIAKSASRVSDERSNPS